MTDATVPPTLEALLAHRAWVRRFARTLAADDASADDLAQDAWVAAVERPPRHAAAPVGWLKRVLVSRAIDLARERGRRSARETAAARGEARAAADEVVAVAESHRRVVEAVMALDEPYRTTILLRFFEDLPPREVASRMGVPVETVRARVRRACDRLRGRLDEEHGGRRAAWLVPLLGPKRSKAAHAARGGAWRWFVTAAAVAGAAVLWVGAGDDGAGVPAATHASNSAAPPARGVRERGPRHAGSGAGATAAGETAAEPPPAARKAPAPDPAAPREFVVRVVDVHRTPVFGVTVRIDPADMPQELDAVSDADGRAVFRVVGNVRTARAAARASDGRIWRPVVQRVRAAPGATCVDCVVERGASIRGTVRRDDGRPFAFAGVLAVDAGRTVASAWADGSGEYELAVPETGVWDIVFSGMSHEEFGTTNSPEGRSTQVMDRGYGPLDGERRGVSPGAQGVDLTMSKPEGTGTIRIVVTTPDGRPLAGVSVAADVGNWAATAARSLSDADGRVALEDVPLCRARVLVADDPRPWVELGCMPPSPELRLRPGAGETVLQLRPARAIRGSVQVPEGFVWPDPARRGAAWVHLLAEGEHVGSTQSRPDGTFALMAPLDAKGPFTLRAALASGDRRGYEASSEVEHGATGVELVLATRDPPPAPAPAAPAGEEAK